MTAADAQARADEYGAQLVDTVATLTRTRHERDAAIYERDAVAQDLAQVAMQSRDRGLSLLGALRALDVANDRLAAVRAIADAKPGATGRALRAALDTTTDLEYI